MIDPVSSLVVMFSLALLPFAVMAVTSYTKISIVLSLVRNAVGVQQVPSNMIINAIALILTCYVMMPVFHAGQSQLLHSHGEGLQRVMDAADAAKKPFVEFLAKHTHEKHIDFFMQAAKEMWSPEQAALVQRSDMIILAPSFLLTELAEAFRIGFILYLVFVVIDLVVASILLAMGMSQVSPTNIAIPFKLLLFVALDGWTKLLQGLVLTYR